MVVLVVVGGAVAVAARPGAHRPQPVHAASLSGDDLRPHADAPVSSRDGPSRVSHTVAAGRLLFVGASYTVGWGATKTDDSYEFLVARRLDRIFSVNAVAGTGFLNPGPEREGTFAERVRRIPVATDPRIVVLQGGRDDSRYAPAREYRAAVSTIRLVQRRFVHARVVVVGPIPARVPVPASLRAINAALQRASATAGAGYIDAIAQGWIDADDEQAYAGAVPGHPDDRGYAFIARRLVADLPAALSASRAPLDRPDDPESAIARPVTGG